MYIAAPENVWYFIEAVLAMIFLLLAQKWFYNGQIYRNREADRKVMHAAILKGLKALNAAIDEKKKEEFDDEDDDEDLDDIVDDFLK